MIRGARGPAIDGEMLRTLRIEAGLTQQALGAAAGHDSSTISRLEASKRNHPSPAITKALADALNVDPSRLLVQEDASSATRRGRESATDKASRYLAEGRLIVSRVVPGEVDAFCRGDGAVYELGYRRGEWFCACPARTRCCHLIALGSVTAPTMARYQ